MTQEREVRALLAELGGLEVPERSPSAEAAQRRRVVGAVDRHWVRLSERGRLTRLWAPGFALVAAAAAVLIVVALGRGHWGNTGAVERTVAALSGDVSLVTPGRAPHRVQGVTKLGGLEHIQTGEQGSAQLRLGVASVELSQSTLLVVEPPAPRTQVGLERGSALFDVLPRGKGESFVVETPDSQVTVVGTRFRISVASPKETRVEVLAGRVQVRHGGEQRLLLPGESWSSTTWAAPEVAGTAVDCARPESSVLTPGMAPAAADSGSHRTAEVGSSRSSGASSVAGSTLSEETRLFGAAMQARRAGDDPRAVASLQQLLARYPASQLAQNARVELFRLYAHEGRRAEAAAAARRYLAQHPGGFAAEEARRVALEATEGTPGDQ